MNRCTGETYIRNESSFLIPLFRSKKEGFTTIFYNRRILKIKDCTSDGIYEAIAGSAYTVIEQQPSFAWSRSELRRRRSLTDSHHSGLPWLMTWRCLPQYTISGLSDLGRCHRTVCGRCRLDGLLNSITKLPLIFRGKRYRISVRMEGTDSPHLVRRSSKSVVFAIPMAAP